MLIVYLQFNLKRGGQRVATMLMYLTDVLKVVKPTFHRQEKASAAAEETLSEDCA